MTSLLHKLSRIALTPPICAISMVIGISAVALADDFYVSGTGTYLTDDGVDHEAYTDLQAAIDAAVAAGTGNTVWVEDGFKCKTGLGKDTENELSRINLSKSVIVRSRSGDWRTGATIVGEYSTTYDESQESTKCGEGAVRCVYSNDKTSQLIGFRLVGGATAAADKKYGGGLYFGVVRNCLIADCAAYGGGGGLYQTTAYDSVVSNCYAKNYGGGANTATISNSTIVLCRAASECGGLNGGTAYDSTIDRCSAGSSGGMRSGTAYRTRILNCTASTYGGGFENSSTLVDCVVSNCTAGSRGGGGGSSANRITGTLFIDNCSNTGSGLMFSGSAIVSNCTFVGNHGWGADVGNAICSRTPTTTGMVVDSVITNNAGVGVRVTDAGNANGSSIVIRRCTINCTNETSLAVSVGKYSDDTRPQGIKLYDSFVSGPIRGSVDCYNCIISGVYSKSYSAVSCDAAVSSQGKYLNLYNCNLVNNVSLASAGGCAGGLVNAYNTIVWQNEGVAGASDSFATAVNCCIDVNPQLITGRFGLPYPTANSPCRTGGKVDAYELTEKDLAGQPRTSNGGTTIAIGACEFDPTLAVAELTMSASSIYRYTCARYSFFAASTGLGSGPLTYYWDFDGDGATDLVTTSSEAPAWKYAAPGDYRPSVSVSNAVSGATATLEGGLSVAERPIHYVKLGSESPLPPYATEEAAAADIASAVACAADGDEVVILPGTYEIAEQIVIDRDISVHGSTGRPEDVIVHETVSDRVFSIHGGNETILHSLTVENGARNDCYDVGSGICLASGCDLMNKNYTPTAALGVVSNVIVRNCHQSSSDGTSSNNGKNARGAGIFAYGAGAIITHCIITNNHSMSCYPSGAKGNGVALHLMNDARAENCLIAGNYTGESSPKTVNTDQWMQNANGNDHAAVCLCSGATLRFCTVVNNAMSFCGGVNVIGDGHFENCVIAGNKVMYKSFAATNARYRVWAAFPETYTRMYKVANPSKYTDDDKPLFEAFIAAEEARAQSPEYYALQTGNVVDVADCGLGAGTVETSTSKLVKDLAAGDYRLPKASPAIDLFDPKDVSMSATRDLYGNPRLQGAAYDAGCYETFRPGLMLLVR